MGRKNAIPPDTRSTWPSPQSSTRAYRAPKRLEESCVNALATWKNCLLAAVSKECGSRGAPRVSISPLSFHSASSVLRSEESRLEDSLNALSFLLPGSVSSWKRQNSVLVHIL